jgi:hypothetical protein
MPQSVKQSKTSAQNTGCHATGMHPPATAIRIKPDLLEKLRPFLNGASASPADALGLRIQQFVALIRGGLDVVVVAMAAASCKIAAPGGTATEKSRSAAAARKCRSRRRDQKSRAHNDWKIPSLLASFGHQVAIEIPR